MAEQRMLDSSAFHPATPSDDSTGPGLTELLKQKVELDDKIQEQFYREKTFMAIDVRKSSEMKKGKNKDDIFLTFDSYHKLIHKHSEENAGQVHETAGDGIMCVFDSADCAVKAAIGIITALPDFNQTENRLKTPLVLRIGLNSGRVLIDERRSIGELFDSVIDIAGHLQKEGRGGDIMITQATHNALSEKGLFKKDKFWESKQIQLYRYALQAGPLADATDSDAAESAPEEFRGMEKFLPILDISRGKSFREIGVNGLVWVKRPGGAVAEGRVIERRPEGDFGVIVVELPDGTQAEARIRTSLRLCGSFERAQILAGKTLPAPEFQRRTAEAIGASGVENQEMKTYILIAAIGIGALFFLILIVLLIK